MLARWFERSGIGQALAPDPDAKPVEDFEEARSEIWQLLAPDDKFAPPRAPPDGSFPPSSTRDGKVQCVHCHRWTPSIADGSAPATIETIVPESPGPATNTNLNHRVPQTPQTPSNGGDNNNNDNSELHSRVLSACRDTSRFMKSPKLERQNNDKFLRLCSSTQPLLPKLLKRMRTMVESNSYKDVYLLRVRATKMGVSAPDGYTSLQCAAYANNIPAAELVLELAEEYASATGDKTTCADLHLDRDLYGMTALHIAGERGNVEMIQFLLPLYEFPVSASSSAAATTTVTAAGLVDLGGQTAFGRAMTSPVPKAKKNQRTLEKNLFSRNDLSIFGEVKSNEERMGRIVGLGLHYGTADMPGLRGYMEDATSVETWRQETSSSSQTMALFSVCDGHGDNGRVSEFIATRVSAVLRECIATHESNRQTAIVPSTEYWTAIWRSVCLKLDRNLKEAFLTEGGSTGVFALVTEQEIVVANVGDSRCILASKSKTTTTIQSSNRNSNSAANEDDDDANQSSNDDDEGEPPLVTVLTTEPSPAADAAAGEETSAPPALIEDDDATATATEKDGKTTSEATTVVAIALSEDHKPNLPEEAQRIETAGFKVQSIRVTEDDGTEIVIHKVLKNDKDQLAVSRAFGDFDYKANDNLGETEQAVVPIADVKVHTRNAETDLYLVLACDGIWDVMDNQDVVDFLQTHLNANSNSKSDTSSESLLPDVADVLLHECLGRESRDNLSAIVVSLQPNISSSNSNITTPESMPPKALDFGSPQMK
eukprot:jgi/Psemu1/286428/fgenesh1_pg.134_\